MNRSVHFQPWDTGMYVAAPLLRPFGTDFGNGEQDRKLFLFDVESDRYAENKRSALRERRGKYVRAFRLSRAVESATIELIIGRLVGDYPERFSSAVEGESRTLIEDGKQWVLPALGKENHSPALDLLARIVEEDFAVVSSRDGLDWVSYLHLCSPSHWAAEDKIGRSFFDVHTPIPGFERANRVSSSIVDAMVNQGPFVRFAWTVESDDRLNHHPEAPLGWDPEDWNGRNFDLGRFWTRVERQVIWGMPKVAASLFSIRVIATPHTQIVSDSNQREQLRSALLSMSEETRNYKGLNRKWSALLDILNQ